MRRGSSLVSQHATNSQQALPYKIVQSWLAPCIIGEDKVRATIFLVTKWQGDLSTLHVSFLGHHTTKKTLKMTPSLRLRTDVSPCTLRCWAGNRENRNDNLGFRFHITCDNCVHGF